MGQIKNFVMDQEVNACDEAASQIEQCTYPEFVALVRKLYTENDYLRSYEFDYVDEVANDMWTENVEYLKSEWAKFTTIGDQL
jgi:hypothetical protein|tara:strand:- start:471 stop:719 length:249 start_codon:yes stop_codon:yes gene_type:complete